MPHDTFPPAPFPAPEEHPASCRCHGTNCRHVILCDHERGESYEIVTDDPCEDYGLAESEQIRDWEDGRGVSS